VPTVRAGVGPWWTERARLVHGFIRWKLIHYSDYLEILQRDPWTFVKRTHGPHFADFALRPLEFSEINPRSMNFSVRSEIQKIFTKRSLASEKSSDSCAKIFRITSSFFLCIHITHVCCILLIDCMCLLHGRKRCAGTVVRGSSRPSFRGVPAVLRRSTRQVSLNMLHL
jgi:hypothetical protein